MSFTALIHCPIERACVDFQLEGIHDRAALSKWIAKEFSFLHFECALRCRGHTAGSLSKGRSVRSRITMHTLVQKGHNFGQVQNMLNIVPSGSPHFQQLGEESGNIFASLKPGR